MVDRDYDEVLRDFYSGLDADGFVRLMLDGSRPWAERDMPEIRGLIEDETLRDFWARGMKSALESTRDPEDRGDHYLLKILACYFANGAVVGYLEAKAEHAGHR